jgi:hypothetical protein
MSDNVIAIDEALCLKQAGDYTRSRGSRNIARYELMKQAQKSNDDALWDKIGAILIEAYREGDLAFQVSDTFVDNCPPAVFLKYANAGPGKDFYIWRRRVHNLTHEPPRRVLLSVP